MPKRGETASPAQKSALKAGQAKRAKALAKGKKGEDTQAQRWAKLISGTITVEDLTDPEVARMRVHGKGGVFSGVPQRLPSNLIAAFHAEQIKRAKSTLTRDLNKAARVLGKILDDPEASNSDKIKAAGMLLERGLGKTPETVHIKTVDPWADTLAAGAKIEDIRDLSSMLDDPQ